MSDSSTPTSFVAPQPADLAPLFPGYQIEHLIATGGMGAVYRAVQKSLERSVAIKILPQEFSSDKSFCSIFESEAKAMARLNHPNLIGVYDFGEVEGMLYIIMEYVPGQSLFHYANGLALDAATVIHLVSGICNGLAHAHQNGIIHRDIKPSNILLDLNGEPKIGDFGLARPVDRQVQDGEVIYGTPHYTAPEVINAPHSVDHRADIFSVGVMLHELLTGRLPANDPRSASAIVQCDPRFDTIIRRATDLIPDRRYASAQEITKDLQIIASSAGPRVLRTVSPRQSGTHGHALPHGYLHPKPSESSPLPALIVAFLVVGGILAFVFMSPSEEPPATDAAPPQTHPELTTPGSTTPSENIASAQPGPGNTRPETTLVEPTPVTPAHSPVPEHDLVVEEETDDDDATADLEQDEKTDATQLAKPKFDVDDFLENRARKIMRQRAEPMIEQRDDKLSKNLTAYERSIKRLLRDYNNREYRSFLDRAVDHYIQTCTRSGHRIPHTPTQNIYNIRGIDMVHTEFLEKQEAFDDTLIEELSTLSATYITGLQMQIDRLNGQDDPVAIELIEDEIKQVRRSRKYFPELMIGEEEEELDEDEEDYDDENEDE